MCIRDRLYTEAWPKLTIEVPPTASAAAPVLPRQVQLPGVASGGGDEQAAALDEPLASMASASAWRDLRMSEEEAFMQLHISERFRVACLLAERASLTLAKLSHAPMLGLPM